MNSSTPPAAAADIAVSAVAFCDPAGNDATGASGNPAKPFRTFAGADALATSSIVLAPGAYGDELLYLGEGSRTIFLFALGPVTLGSLSIVGGSSVSVVGNGMDLITVTLLQRQGVIAGSNGPTVSISGLTVGAIDTHGGDGNQANAGGSGGAITARFCRITGSIDSHGGNGGNGFDGTDDGFGDPMDGYDGASGGNAGNIQLDFCERAGIAVNSAGGNGGNGGNGANGGNNGNQGAGGNAGSQTANYCVP